MSYHNGPYHSFWLEITKKMSLKTAGNRHPWHCVKRWWEQDYFPVLKLSNAETVHTFQSNVTTENKQNKLGYSSRKYLLLKDNSVNYLEILFAKMNILLAKTYFIISSMPTYSSPCKACLKISDKTLKP